MTERHVASEPGLQGYVADHHRIIVLLDGEPVKDWTHAYHHADGYGHVSRYVRGETGGIRVVSDGAHGCEAVTEDLAGRVRWVRDTAKDREVLIDISWADKYRYVQSKQGSTLYRHGEPWRDATGDGCICALAYALQTAREEPRVQARKAVSITESIGDLSVSKTTITETMEPRA